MASRFWNKKGKDESAAAAKKPGKPEGELSIDPEIEKRKVKHSLSISRSGRFKQKRRDRSGVLDQPELFQGPSSTKVSPSNSHSHSPGPAYRSSRPQIPANLRMNPSVPSVAS